MAQENSGGKSLEKAIYKCEIRQKLPSLNDYVRACRADKIYAGRYKRELEEIISFYLQKLPTFDEPVRIHFIWIEENKRRDLDNVAFAKKFILDALVKCGKLKDDNRRCVVAFTDSFEYKKPGGVILEIETVKE